MLGVAVLVAPLYWITADPVLTYNVAFDRQLRARRRRRCTWLARELTGSRPAALVAGMYYAFGPFRMSQYAHLQMVATGWMPIALFGLHRYFSTRRPRWLLVTATGWVMQTLSNMYIGYFIALPIAVVAADGLWRARDRRTRVMRDLVAAGAPRRRSRSRRPGRPTIAPAPDYQQVRDHRRGRRRQRRPAVVRGRQEQRRRLALAADGGRASIPKKNCCLACSRLGLAAIGLWTRGRRSAAPALGDRLRRGGDGRRHPSPSVHIPASGDTSSPRTGRTGWLLAIVPGMDGMRVPARFAIVVIAALSVLVAFGADWLLRRVSGSRRSLATLACVAMVVADGWAAPIATVAVQREGPSRGSRGRVLARRSRARRRARTCRSTPQANSCSTISS